MNPIRRYAYIYPITLTCPWSEYKFAQMSINRTRKYLYSNHPLLSALDRSGTPFARGLHCWTFVKVSKKQHRPTWTFWWCTKPFQCHSMSCIMAVFGVYWWLQQWIVGLVGTHQSTINCVGYSLCVPLRWICAGRLCRNDTNITQFRKWERKPGENSPAKNVEREGMGIWERKEQLRMTANSLSKLKTWPLLAQLWPSAQPPIPGKRFEWNDGTSQTVRKCKTTKSAGALASCHPRPNLLL